MKKSKHVHTLIHAHTPGLRNKRIVHKIECRVKTARLECYAINYRDRGPNRSQCKVSFIYCAPYEHISMVTDRHGNWLARQQECLPVEA